MPTNIKLGISPINWVNEDVLELGDHYTFEDLLADFTALGFTATEMCRKFPRDPQILRPALAERGIQLSSQWKGVLFSDPAYRETELAAYRKHVEFLKEMGSKHVVTCELGGSIIGDPRRAAGQQEVIPLSESAWNHMVEGLHQAGEICREYGMKLVYHHHVGTVVERPEEIDRLMAATNPELVSLLYDTGHAYYGGGDPLTLLKKHGGRIPYVHLKDIRQPVLDRVIHDSIVFQSAVIQGVFTVPGDGCIDFGPILEELSGTGYEGWMIIEAEQDPSVANPYDYAKKSKQHIYQLTQRIRKKSLKVGIIGAGRIGKLHAANLYANPRIEIMGISDIRPELAEEWAVGLGVGQVVGDYQQILHNPDIDVIYICSSTDSHALIIEEAAKAGKHIFCEKPISFDVQVTKRAVAAAEQAGVHLQIGFNRRFDPNFERMKSLITQGSTGDPHIIKITSRDPSPPSADYIKSSGGMFLDMSIHDFDMARFLGGSEVVEVYVKGAVLIDPMIGELGDLDTAVIVLSFQNGAIGVIDNSRKAVYGYDQRVEVFGSKGSMTVQNDFPNSVELSTVEGVFKDKPEYFFLERYRTAFVKETEAFIDAILENRAVSVNGNDSYQAERIARAAKLSWLEQRPVKLSEI